MKKSLHLSLWMVAILVVGGCASTSADTPTARNQTASLEMGRQMVSQGEYQRAVQFLLPRSRQPDAPGEVHSLLGLSFLGLNNPTVALKSFKAALEADKEDDDARLNLGYTYILLARYQESRDVLNDILKRKKYLMMEKVHLNIGLTFLQEKRCDKALVSFQAALDIDPTYSAPHYNIGKCQSATGRLKEAQASFQRAVDFCPGCIEPQLELATTTARLGERKKALQQLNELLRLKPTGVNEQRALALKKQIAK